MNYSYSSLFLLTLVLVLFSLVEGNAQIFKQDSLLKVHGVNEIIFTKDVYYDKNFNYNAPVMVGYDSLNTEGKAFTKVRYLTSKILTSKYIYSTTGLLIENFSFVTNVENTHFAQEYEYDDSDRLINIYKFNKEGLHEKTDVYTYDDENRLKSLLSRSETDDYKTKEVLYYNDRNKVSDIVFFRNDQEIYTTRHKYDQFNNLKIEYIYSTEKKRCSIIYDYDSSNRLIKKTYAGLGNVIGRNEIIHINSFDYSKDIIKYVYVYQENGLLASRLEMKNGITIAKLKYRYIYY